MSRAEQVWRISLFIMVELTAHFQHQQDQAILLMVDLH